MPNPPAAYRPRHVVILAHPSSHSFNGLVARTYCEEVRRQGIQVSDNTAGFAMVLAINSRSGDTSGLELGNFAATKVVNELRRVPGVGNALLFSSEKAMRIWLDPEKLAGFGLSAAEALAAVQEQNSQTAGGALGDQMEEMEKRAIREALEKSRYNKTRAAQLLGMSFRSLRYRIKKLNLE